MKGRDRNGTPEAGGGSAPVKFSRAVRSEMPGLPPMMKPPRNTVQHPSSLRRRRAVFPRLRLGSHNRVSVDLPGTPTTPHAPAFAHRLNDRLDAWLLSRFCGFFCRGFGRHVSLTIQTGIAKTCCLCSALFCFPILNFLHDARGFVQRRFLFGLGGCKHSRLCQFGHQ